MMNKIYISSSGARIFIFSKVHSAISGVSVIFTLNQINLLKINLIQIKSSGKFIQYCLFPLKYVHNNKDTR